MTDSTAPVVVRARSALREFLRLEAAGGIVLIAAAAAALILANLPATAAWYQHLLHQKTGVTLSAHHGEMTLHLWVNDGLMAIFFLFVGLEIKREFVDGRLASWERRRLPFIAALAGMAVPALLYLAVTRNHGALAAGWAIPAATDIAFAIGVLALLGSRAPASLKLFLTTVAIVDDMGAVAIIALAYTQHIDIGSLVGAGLVVAAMAGLGRLKVQRLLPYLLLGALLWLLVFRSGIHATIAGVVTAALIPITKSPGTPDAAASPLHRLEHAIDDVVAFGVVPLFGFANAGVVLTGLRPADLIAPLPLGVALGLFAGKQLGIFGSIWLAVRTGIAKRPGGAGWAQIYGVALLAGIGFTMSLFIGGLAFPGAPELGEKVKLGVLMGSVLSALAGFAVLRFAPRRAAS